MDDAEGGLSPSSPCSSIATEVPGKCYPPCPGDTEGHEPSAALNACCLSTWELRWQDHFQTLNKSGKEIQTILWPASHCVLFKFLLAYEDQWSNQTSSIIGRALFNFPEEYKDRKLRLNPLFLGTTTKQLQERKVVLSVGAPGLLRGYPVVLVVDPPPPSVLGFPCLFITESGAVTGVVQASTSLLSLCTGPFATRRLSFRFHIPGSSIWLAHPFSGFNSHRWLNINSPDPSWMSLPLTSLPCHSPFPCQAGVF